MGSCRVYPIADYTVIVSVCARQDRLQSFQVRTDAMVAVSSFQVLIEAGSHRGLKNVDSLTGELCDRDSVP